MTAPGRLALALLLLLAGAARADEVIPLCLADGSPGGTLTIAVQTNGDVCVRFDEARTINDNSYGQNTVNWPRNHNFSDLVGSDKAHFQFRNASGALVLDFELDYLSNKSGTPSGYASLGVSGGDGSLYTGSAAHVLEWQTSQAENLNGLGLCSGGDCTVNGVDLLQDSPPADTGYNVLDPEFSGWNFTISYFVKVSHLAFGASGFGSVSVPTVHNSPPKFGSNAATLQTCPTPCEGDGRIGDFVWHDQDGDGLQDPGEPGIGGVVVSLRSAASGALLATTTTSGSGFYQFTGLCAGTYRVEVSTPPGFASTLPEVGSDRATDSNTNPTTVTLATGDGGGAGVGGGGTTDDTIDFGFVFTCGECRGKVTRLTLQYNGATTSQVRVVQRNNQQTVFDGMVDPGEQFTFHGTSNGTLDNNIDIFVNGVLHASIHTSCSQPIGPNLIAGDFEVIEGFSKDGGRLCPVLRCLSVDPTNAYSCFKEMSDAELDLLIHGNQLHPFDPPEVCGMPVPTAAAARDVLRSTSCKGLKREALTLIFNIRRSFLFGDGRLGDDGAACFGVDPFRIVLCCGSVFVPAAGAGIAGGGANGDDENHCQDARVVTELMPVVELVALASELCDLADCPGSGDRCARTVESLEDILKDINESRDDEGDCPLCPGDTTPPVLSCPGGLLTFECSGPDGAPIDYHATATDNCDPAPVLTCFPPPGTVLPTGTRRTVTCTASDFKGNMSTCSFDVLVVDTTPPRIFCPSGPIVVDCTAGQKNGAVVDYPDPTASDDCDAQVALVCNPPGGSFFPFGATTVVCTATDDSGNTARCEFEVVVVEETTPELICPADITVECTGPDGATVHYPPPMVSATCNPPPAPSCTPPSGSVFPLGMTTVTCRTTGPGGKPIECRFTVTVTDTHPPVITCPQDILAECTSPAGAAVVYSAGATDTCDASPAVTCNPPSGSVFPPGSTTVRCEAVDASGNGAACEFRVIVRDTTAPDITCPQGPIIVACTMQGPPPGAIANYPPPAVNDSCDENVTVVCVPPPGSFFQLGMTDVTCTATDAAGNSSSCTFKVNVVDEAPPMLVCPGDLVRECTGPDGAVVTYPMPMVADDCDVQPHVTCDPPSGSLFPIGMTTVTCTARDASGNTTSCSFKVTVEDSTGPSIRCPADIVVECASPAGTPVEFVVTATDTCDPNPVVTCNPPSGSLFPPGPTVVECTATDEHGNRGTCRFTVSVVDTLPPEVACPANRTVECESPAGATVTFTSSAVDACGGSVPSTCDPPSGSVFPHGTTTVTCTAADSSGNMDRCTFEITVVDTTPPSITCPRDAVVIECDSSSGGSAQYPPPVASDLCDPAPRVVCDPPAGSILPLGPHTITCTATDAAGNSSMCSFEVTVVDRAPPALVCPEDIRRECTGPEGAVVEYPPPTPTDTCDPAPNLVCLPPSGSIFPIGDNLVVCTADDQNGNMVTCNFHVVVVDTTPPVIQCPSDTEVMCSSPAGTPVNFTVTATDLCDPMPLVSCDPPSGSIFPAGQTTVTCTARDNEGNTSRCTFTVTVRDQAPPVIVCPQSFERECVQGGTAFVEYPPPGVTDDCDPAPRVVCDPPPGTRLPPGAHPISCTATDAAGNMASCEFTVTVVDRAEPMLMCPPDARAECTGPEGAVVSYPLPVANDACDGQPPVACVPPPGSVFPLGSTEVVCTSRDAAGNSTMCSFLVTIVDTRPPSISCPQPIVAGCGSAAGAVVDFTVTATDACDPGPELSCNPPSGSLFPPGMTTVTCSAVDMSGNRSECSFTVTVLDRTAPDLVCPLDITAGCTTAGQPAHKPPGWPPGSTPPANVCSAVVNFAVPATSDACQPGAIQMVCNPPPGTRLGLGRHTITCRARDAAGNEATCTFVVEVVLGENAFIRGDSNASGSIDIADGVWIVNDLFLGGPDPPCGDAADTNDDADYSLTDVVFILNYQFLGGRRPPEPFLPLCGLDPTADAIGCNRYRPCE